jgi:hypothetical protein
METSIRASRRRVARTRGALSGLLLMVLGLWAALVPFIGPSFDLGYTPRPDSTWHWTAARGWLEVLPGAAAFLGGLLLLVSTSRAMTVFGGWLAALGGAWLVIGPALAPAINLDPGQPDPTMGTNARAATALLYFFAIGAVILFIASVGLGRVSVLSVRDVRAAERRAETEEAQRQAALDSALADRQDRRDVRDRDGDGVDDAREGAPDGGRHAEPADARPTAITNVPPPADSHVQHQPVPQYAGQYSGGGQQPTQAPTQRPTQQSGAGTGQYAAQPPGEYPTQSYPAAPPVRDDPAR